MNKKLYMASCILVAASLCALNTTYGNTPVNAATDTSSQTKAVYAGAIVSGVAATAAVATGISVAMSHKNDNDHQATNNNSSSGDALDTRLQIILDKYRKEYNVPGLSMSVSLGPNSRTRNYVSGTTKLNGTQPLNADTIFQIGSDTKAFTSAIILQLEAEGKLNIHDTLGKYLPNEYPKWNNVTLIQLMNMTSGIFDICNSDEFSKEMIFNPQYRHKKWTLKGLTDASYAEHSDLLFPPGTKWSYSNMNYNLLGMIIEKITGNTYKHELEARLIGENAPYGIKNTYYIPDSPTNYPDYIKNNMAYAYYEDESMYGNTTVHDVTDVTLSPAGPFGAITSTLKDNITWDRDLFGGKVLKPQQQQEIQNNCVSVPVPNNYTLSMYYCLGVAYLPNYQVTKNYILPGNTWSYTGGYYGQNFSYELLPDNTVIVIAENANYSDHFLNVGVGPGDLVPAVIMAVENHKKTYPFINHK